jgi:hypothetical protein
MRSAAVAALPRRSTTKLPPVPSPSLSPPRSSFRTWSCPDHLLGEDVQRAQLSSVRPRGRRTTIRFAKQCRGSRDDQPQPVTAAWHALHSAAGRRSAESRHLVARLAARAMLHRRRREPRILRGGARESNTESEMEHEDELGTRSGGARGERGRVRSQQSWRGHDDELWNPERRVEHHWRWRLAAE